ncbi:molybdopterin molybdotransferase MoeA [Mesoterricola sediminis]|uniref:Molybdopterin molybdenumtransferase n=1 Tax=Mesoterricola sediminis TaxID=2927980 RepID=A0AA48H366_9BACT|nr:gephyrin-like molybdotransferase Glp [Mesoterricola sediminis]BDU75163.1 molybdopterin molybdenumtransferase MoeA [Mesoterricola sediminis]
MLGYEEALQRVLAHAAPLPPRVLPLAEALGLAAAEDIHALEPVPPFRNAAMDGFAVRVEDAARGRLPVGGTLAAGMAHVPPLAPGTAVRIMTGAPVPPEADAVVPLEEAVAEGGEVTFLRPPRPGAHIRLPGEDIPEGGRVVPAGAVIRPAEAGVLAAIGRPTIPVRPRPRVAVLTTGNELVDAGTRPGPGQIRDANIHSLCAQVQAAGGVPLPFPRVEDTREAVAAALAAALEAADVVLTNGGISVGDFDYIKAVLEAEGAEQVFWRVAQKPGAPLGLWVLRGRPVFGIPGNPVAAMLMFEAYVRPALRSLMGYPHLHRPERTGTMAALWKRSGDPRRTEFLRVIAERSPEGLRVRLAGPQGSGILSSLVRANAIALVPEGLTSLTPGDPVRLQMLDEPEDH